MRTALRNRIELLFYENDNFILLQLSTMLLQEIFWNVQAILFLYVFDKHIFHVCQSLSS